MRWVTACLALSTVLLGCASGSAAPVGTCPTWKMEFTQATGCHNDGSVELCLPKDERVVERIRALAPDLQGAIGGRGRVGCVMERESLYFFPTRTGIECLEQRPGLSDEAWGTLCRIAADPAVPRIVPTWYE